MNFVSLILALCPIILLIIIMMVFKRPAWQAAIGAAILAAIEALLYWKTPASAVGMAAVEGAAMAFWPIVLVIIAAVFTYNLVCSTGGMDVIKTMLTSVSPDKRVLVLLVAWCFGGFMEGMAGFGTAIAIPAGMMMAMGFDPLFSCLICLLSNGFPTPWGSIGIPTVTVASLLNMPGTTALSTMQVIQVAVFFIAIPFLLVVLTGKGVKALKGMTGVCLGAGLGFVLPMLVVSAFVGAELVVVIGSVFSLAITVLLGKRVKPDPEYLMSAKEEKKEEKAAAKITLKDALVACAPFLFIFVFLLGSSKLVPPVNSFLSQFSTTVYFVNENSATTFAWINTPGVWIFLSAILGALIQKASFKQFTSVFKATLKQMTGSIIVMVSVLMAAKIMIYSGMISDIAKFAIAAMGGMYPIIAPWLGALGAFVTGSGTSSGVLFGKVQADAAAALNMNEYWVVGLNALGIGVGKMLSPQSIAIGLSAVGGLKEDSKLLKMALPYGAAFIVICSIIAGLGIVFVH
ncbi:lactate permease LctP family transporter [Erysipelotrichaceae bacterium 51-3]